MSQIPFDSPMRVSFQEVAISVVSGSPNTATPVFGTGGGLMQVLTVGSTLGTFTLSNPAGVGTFEVWPKAFLVDRKQFFIWHLKIINSSGGALTVTLGSAYTTVTPTYPANGKSRYYTFSWDGSTHQLMYQSSSDLG